jgi:hypothetical protein
MTGRATDSVVGDGMEFSAGAEDVARRAMVNSRGVTDFINLPGVAWSIGRLAKVMA